MKRIKRILIIAIIVTILTPVLCPFLGEVNARELTTQSSHDGGGTDTLGLTNEQQSYLATYVRIYLAEAHKMTPIPFVYDSVNGGYDKHFFQNELFTQCCDDPDHEYSASKLRQSGTTGSGVTYSNRMRTVCSVFTASMLHQALGVTGLWATEPRGAGFANPDNRGKDFFNHVKNTEALQAGDIITYTNGAHSLIYIGPNPETGEHEWAQTDGSKEVVRISKIADGFANRQYITIEMVNNARGRDEVSLYASRLKPEVLDPNWKIPEVTKIQWPNGLITTWSGEIADVSTQTDPNQPLFYAGLPEKIGTLGRTDPISEILERLKKFFNDIIDYLIGIITMVIRIPVVGFAHVAEWLVTQLVTLVSTEQSDYILTLEKIVYNQVPIFDINIFDMGTAGGKAMESDSIIIALRQNVANWYYAFRNLIIVVLLVILLYLGIRMAITSIAEEKAQYKRMLVDWFISFFMVFFIHYFIIIILEINEALVGFFASQAGSVGIGSLYESTSILAHSAKFTDGWYGTIMYVALVWFMVKYAWKYAKRLLNAFILTMLSPLVAVSYAIDKIKDNRSQSLAKWLKEIAFTILIQSVHALIYTVFLVGIVSQITENNNVLEAIGGCVFLVIAVSFMDTAEDIFETIFGLNNASSTKEIMDNSFEMYTKFKAAKSIAKDVIPVAKNGAKGVGKVSGGVLNFVTRGKFKEKIAEPIKKGYKQEMEGNIPQADTIASTPEQMKKIQERKKKQQDMQKKLAKKNWQTSKAAIGSMLTGAATMSQNPISAITYLIAGGASAKHLARLTKKNASKMGIGQFEKEKKVLMPSLQEDIKLKEMIDEKYQDPDSLLARGFAENATDEEKIQARQLQRILNQRLQESSKIVGKNDVEKAVRTTIITATHQGKNSTLAEIISALETGSSIKVNRAGLYDNLRDEIKKSLVRSKIGEIESIKFGEKIISEIISEQPTQSLSDSLIEDSIAGAEELLEKESIAQIESQVDEYFNVDGDKKVDEIIQKLAIEDATHIIMRAINREGSFERNSQTKLGEGEYEKAVEQAVEQGVQMPSTREGVQEFAQRMARNSPGISERNFVQKFAQNVDIQLDRIKGAIEGKVELTEIRLLSTERIDEIVKSLDGEDITTDKILDKLTNDEKTRLLKKSATSLAVKTTPQMDAELAEFDAIIEQTIRLRESAIEATDRIDLPMPDLVKQIRTNARKETTVES